MQQVSFSKKLLEQLPDHDRINLVPVEKTAQFYLAVIEISVAYFLRFSSGR